MSNKIHIGYLLGAIASFTLLISTLTGILQTLINFTGAMNEIIFTLGMFILTVLCILGIKR